jgi:hypothetical protein
MHNFIFYRFPLLVSAGLGFLETLFLIEQLGLTNFGKTAVVVSVTLVIYGLFDIRVGELIVLSNNSGLWQGKIVRKILTYEMSAIAVSVATSMFTARFVYDLNKSFAIGIGLLALLPNVCSNIRLIIDSGKFHPIWNLWVTSIRGIPLMYLVLAATGIAPVISLQGFSFSLSLMISWLLLLPLSAHVAIKLANKNSRTPDNQITIRTLIFTNWSVSTASGIYRQADVIFSALIAGPAVSATIKIWMQIIAPLSLAGDIKSQRTLTRTDQRSENLLLSPELAGGLAATLVLAVVVQSRFEEFLTGSYYLGTALFINAAVVLLGAHQRVEIMKIGKFSYLSKVSWLVTSAYAVIALLIANSIKSMATLLVVRIMFSLIVLITLKNKVEQEK